MAWKHILRVYCHTPNLALIGTVGWIVESPKVQVGRLVYTDYSLWHVE